MPTCDVRLNAVIIIVCEHAAHNLDIGRDAAPASNGYGRQALLEIRDIHHLASSLQPFLDTGSVAQDAKSQNSSGNNPNFRKYRLTAPSDAVSRASSRSVVR